jgi:hypothetical protein
VVPIHIKIHKDLLTSEVTKSQLCLTTAAISVFLFNYSHTRMLNNDWIECGDGFPIRACPRRRRDQQRRDCNACPEISHFAFPFR